MSWLQVLLYVDLHGHSKKSNIFMYGVENPTDEALYMRERIIPTLLDQASPLFNSADCTFDVSLLVVCIHTHVRAEQYCYRVRTLWTRVALSKLSI